MDGFWNQIPIFTVWPWVNYQSLVIVFAQLTTLHPPSRVFMQMSGMQSGNSMNEKVLPNECAQTINFIVKRPTPTRTRNLLKIT